MSDQELHVKKSGGEVSIEVVVGEQAWGTYKIKLWDKDSKDPKTVGNGFSGDQISDEHSVGKPTATLNGRYLTWKIRVASFSDSGTSNLSATVLIRQGGSTVDGGVFPYTGQYEGVKTVGGFVRLVVK